jgi:hypothetical protein
MPHVRVPRHVARLIINYIIYAARPGSTARRRLLRLRRVSGCLGTSRSSSSTTSHTPRVRVPRHVARLVVDYFASRILVVDYFAYVARPGASARHAAHRRLLHLA